MTDQIQKAAIEAMLKTFATSFDRLADGGATPHEMELCCEEASLVCCDLLHHLAELVPGATMADIGKAITSAKNDPDIRSQVKEMIESECE